MSTVLPAPNPRLTRRALLRGAVRLSALSAATALGGTAYASQIEPDWVEIERLELVLPRLPRAFDGFRLAHISDIHIEGGDMARRFAAVCDLVSAQGADAIALTGDYAAYEGRWQEQVLFEGLRRLQAPAGVFGVMGNHDYSRAGDGPGAGDGVVPIRRAFERAGVRELPNQAVAIGRGNEKLWIAGLDDAITGHADLEALGAQIPARGAAILLHHEPDLADEIAPTGRFDLMLSGHSHGGQIALPILGPFHLPTGGRKYPRGLYRVGEMALYTNRGLGTIELPIRFCSRPEITLLTLKSA